MRKHYTHLPAMLQNNIPANKKSVKKHFLLCCMIFLTAIAHGQLNSGGMNGPAVAPRDFSFGQNIVTINGSDGFYLKKDLYLINYTVIDGHKVLGIPFLFIDWLNGTLITPDGRTYPDYKLKYNAYNQTVSFLNGTDSMEVNEPVKEFTLKTVHDDSVITSRFTHSSNYKKTKSFYYEILVDGDKGQLLKTNQKTIVSGGDGIIAPKTTQYLNLEWEYYYFEKKSKKITRIRPNSDMKLVLGVTDEIAKEINLDSFEITNEQSLMALFSNYFNKAKIKGF
jgi:hypothetical protein